MIPPGPDHDAPSDGPGDRGQGFPDPPYPPELIADLHAGVLTDELSAHLYARIADDPAAQRILRALEDTRDQLHNAPVDPVAPPRDVEASVAATLAGLRTPSTPASDPTRAVRRRTLVTVLAAAAVVIAALAVSIAILRPSDDESTPPVAEPTTTHTLDGAEQVSALSVLGRTDGAPFVSINALRRCTSANGVPAQTATVGSGPITVGGRPAAVILLSTGVAGRFEALVVGLDCDTNNPATVSRTVIGAG